MPTHFLFARGPTDFESKPFSPSADVAYGVGSVGRVPPIEILMDWRNARTHGIGQGSIEDIAPCI